MLTTSSLNFRFNLVIYKVMATIGVFLVVFPKINLISVPGQSAGLRVDDLLIALLCILVFFMALINAKIHSAQGYILWISSALLSYLMSIFTGQPSSALYVARLVEYYVFFYFGMYATLFYSIEKICFLVLNLNAIAIFLQFFGVWGGFSSDGYVNSVGRCIGLTAGPWEVGFLINSIYVLLRCFKEDAFGWRYFLLFLYTLCLIVLTGARIPLLCHMILFVGIEYKFSQRKSLIVVFIASFLALLFIALLSINNQVVARSQGLFSYDNIETMLDYYNAITVPRIFDGFPDIANGGEATDMSWLIRASHWVVALKTWSLSYIYTLFGVGVGTFGPALDGAWTRIITETGALGIVIYVMYIVRVGMLTSWSKFLTIAIAINMLMIDIHISYKSMAFVLFVTGYLQAYKNKYGRTYTNE